MTLDQLQIFIAVAGREHITRAAGALGLTPPSVSAAVASLEREFGTKLFHRVGRGIVMSEGGKLLLNEARALVNRPALLLADEPTGNLDTATADQVLTLLSDHVRWCRAQTAS